MGGGTSERAVTLVTSAQHVVVKSPYDMHVHFRDGQMMNNVVSYTSDHFAGALVMPNLVPPVTTIEQCMEYRSRILKVTKEQDETNNRFTPYMTLYLQVNNFFRDKQKLKAMKLLHGDVIKAFKLYPKGMTTNSDHGVVILPPTLNGGKELYEVFEAMEEAGIILCVHGETDGFVLDREREFCETYKQWATRFPKLKIVMEHITTKEAVDLLLDHENLYATITVHHLLITLNDVIGGMLDPHLFCKPVAKLEKDKAALRHLAGSSHRFPRVMFGSDSAPHPQSKKECCGCAAGVFTAPIALPLLAQVFEDMILKKEMDHGIEQALSAFTSWNARKLYDLPEVKKEVVLTKKESYKVADHYGGVVPMWAGRHLAWSVDHVI